MRASQYGHIEIVRLLVDKGAQIDLQGINGFTALIVACMNESTEIVKLLLEKGANADLRDKEGKMALDYTENSKIKSLLDDYSKKQP
jgi:ankyrin repeat protein